MKKTLGILAIGALMAAPTLAFAAPYAYVNTAGEVRMVEAVDAMTALRTATGIHPRSGVMLLQTSNDGIIGDTIR